MYKLELISAEPKKRKYPHPLLFVHGAYVAAWCWEEFFLDYFAKQGFSAHALSLRGHGESEGSVMLHSFHLRDYAEDLSIVIDSLDAQPVMIGHSMGGMVIQKFLEHETVPGAAFLTTIPITGVGLAGFEIAMRSPMMYAQLMMVQNMGSQYATPGFAREALFSHDVKNSVLFKYQPKFQAESTSAIWDVSFFDMPVPARVKKVPMLFLGAENDHLFTPHLIRQTAEAYGCEAEFIPNTAHMIMLDPRWKLCADRLITWLNTLP